MYLLNKRIFRGEQYTIGRLSINGAAFCDVLEPPDRGLSSDMPLSEITHKKIYKHTAIPAGTYVVNMGILSPKFANREWAIPYGGKIPTLMKVPGFDRVLIHVGNSVADTDACLLVGENKEKGKVLNSVRTFRSLMDDILVPAELRGEEIKIEIQ